MMAGKKKEGVVIEKRELEQQEMMMMMLCLLDRRMPHFHSHEKSLNKKNLTLVSERGEVSMLYRNHEVVYAVLVKKTNGLVVEVEDIVCLEIGQGAMRDGEGEAELKKECLSHPFCGTKNKGQKSGKRYWS